ncbi:MAG: hypothetical protein NT121_02910, partial [Chloroflexi bacterium]|nr:hypothetical protein [Chloroflexota bacterium]
MQHLEFEIQKSVLMGEVLLFGLLGKALYQNLDKDWLETLIQEEIFAEAPFGAEQAEIKSGLEFLQR